MKICYYLFGVSIPFYLQYFLPAYVLYNFIGQLLKNKYFRLFLIFIPSTLIFVKLLRNDPFFFSDDFAHLRIGSEYSYWDFIKHSFIGPGIWVGHRIIGAFWLFKAALEVFGPKAEAFLTINFLLHSLNVLLFYLTAEKIRKSPINAFAAFILGSYYLTWISNMHEILGATFLLTSLYFWVKWLKREKKSYLASFVFYLLAIVSKEITFLLPLALVSLSLSYHSYVSKLNLRRTVKYLIPFFVIFLIYLFTYASGFLGYKNLPDSDSYKTAFSLSSFVNNLLFYATYTFPIIESSLIRLVFVLLPLLLFDIWKRKPITTSFIFSFLLFLGPALMFRDRVSYYYSYIATFFLFLGVCIFLMEIYSLIRKFLSGKPEFLKRIVTVYFVLFLALGIFRINKLFMDNCFLVLSPWKNEHKATLYRIAENVDEKIRKGEVGKGEEIKLIKEDLTPEMEFIFESGVLQLFLKEKEAENLRFIYNKDRGSLTLNAK